MRRQPVTETVEAARTARAAAAEAGPRSADSIAVTCDLIRFGVFFDGTGNSRNHAGTGDVSWHTNVDLLEQKYETTNAPVVRRVGAERRKVNYGSIYARGIGVESGGGTTTYGMALGMGSEGVRQRVNQTINQIRTQLRSKASGMEVCDLWFDVFGFSRGAAAARHFANRAPVQALSVQGTQPETRFMGLYDTVVMIGPGVSTSGSGDLVYVETNNSANRIVHITADNEIRENFPLTRARGERRYRIAGVHSDVGGGYNPNRRNDQRGSFAFEHEDYPGLPRYLRESWGLSTTNRHGADRESPDSLISVRQSRAQPWDAGEWRSTFNWSCHHGLQHVTLRIMFEEARAYGVPLTPWTNSIAGVDVSLSGMLLEYYNALRSGRPTTELENRIRLRYSHVSFNGDRNWGFRPHLPKTDGVRHVAIR